MYVFTFLSNTCQIFDYYFTCGHINGKSCLYFRMVWNLKNVRSKTSVKGGRRFSIDDLTKNTIDKRERKRIVDTDIEIFL